MNNRSPVIGASQSSWKRKLCLSSLWRVTESAQREPDFLFLQYTTFCIPGPMVNYLPSVVIKTLVDQQPITSYRQPPIYKATDVGWLFTSNPTITRSCTCCTWIFSQLEFRKGKKKPCGITDAKIFLANWQCNGKVFESMADLFVGEIHLNNIPLKRGTILPQLVIAPLR